MNYTSVILNRLIDIYEHRGLFRTADSKKHQGIFLSVEKTFPEYNDLYDERAYQEINEAIEHLRQRGILQGNKDERGQYGKLRFQIETIEARRARDRGSATEAGGCPACSVRTDEVNL